MMQEGRQSIQAFLEEVRAKIPVPLIWENGDHVASRLLTPAENTRVMKIVGKKRKALATTVAQVWFAYPKEENAWKVKFTGVLCFVKDSIMKSHFIRLLDIEKTDENDGIMWEQEIYRQFRYNAVKDYFHTFEGDYCNIGLNFCDLEEASYFHQCIKERIAFFKKLRASIKAKREMRNTKIGENPAVQDIISSVRVKHGIHVTAQNWKAKHNGRRQSQDGATESTHPAANIASNDQEANLSSTQGSGEEDLKKSAKSGPLRNGQYKMKAYLAAFKNQNRPEVVSSWSSSAIGQSSGWIMSQGTGQTSNSNRSQITGNSGSPERSHEERRSTLPLTNQVLHPMARRNQLLLNNNNKVAMKLQEQQREYHSSMIKSLVMERDAKAKQKQPTKVVDGAVKENAFTRGGDTSKSTEVKPKNRSKALQKPMPQFAIQDKTTDGGIKVQGIQNHPVVSNVPGQDSGRGLPSNNWESSMAWGIQKDPVCLSAPGDDSTAALPPPPDGWESNFSFPSLPSMDKLELTSSMTNGSIASEKASHAALTAGDLEGSEVVPPIQNVAGFEGTAQQSGATAAVPVLDVRAELMKSIIAGKKLNKVSPGSSMRRPAFSHAGAIADMVGCLTKALEGRNKALRDSSSEDDYDIDYDYEWEDIQEEWD